jgi:hypothetical protein
MAENFTNAKAVLGDSATTIYTCPAATKAIVIGCQVTNVTASTNGLDFYWTDASDSNAVTYLSDAIGVPTQSSYEPIGGKLVLEAGDSLVGISSTNLGLEATVSVLELS